MKEKNTKDKAKKKHVMQYYDSNAITLLKLATETTYEKKSREKKKNKKLRGISY